MPKVWQHVAGNGLDLRPKLKDEERGGAGAEYPYEYVGYDDLTRALSSQSGETHEALVGPCWPLRVGVPKRI